MNRVGRDDGFEVSSKERPCHCYMLGQAALKEGVRADEAIRGVLTSVGHHVLRIEVASVQLRLCTKELVFNSTTGRAQTRGARLHHRLLPISRDDLAQPGGRSVGYAALPRLPIDPAGSATSWERDLSQ